MKPLSSILGMTIAIAILSLAFACKSGGEKTTDLKPGTQNFGMGAGSGDGTGTGGTGNGDGSGTGTGDGSGSGTGSGDGSPTASNDPDPTNPPATVVPASGCKIQTDASLAGGKAETFEECDAKGLVWIPIVNGDHSKATCGPPKVANFNCCELNIAKVYPSLSAENSPPFNALLKDNLAKGFQMHHCEQRTSGEIVVHFYNPVYKAPNDTNASRSHRWICANGVVRDTTATQSNCPALDKTKLAL